MCKKLIFLISFVLVLSLANVASARTPDDLVLWAEYLFDAPDPCADTSVNDSNIVSLAEGATVGVAEGYEGTAYHGDVGDYNETLDAYQYIPYAVIHANAWPGTETGNFTIEMMINFDEEVSWAYDPILEDYRDIYGHVEGEEWPWFTQHNIVASDWYFQFEYGEYDEFSVFWITSNLWYAQGPGWMGYASGPINLEKDIWYHWVASIDNEHKVMRHWIDGELVAEDSDHAGEDFSGAVGNFYLGCDGDWDHYPFRGRIDGLRFYKGYTETSFEPGYPAMPKPWATMPEPGDGADGVARPVKLTWKPGNWVQDVNGHEVYFSTSFADVNDANRFDTTGIYRGPNDVYVDPCDPNRFAYDVPDSLGLGETLFWRIDEVNEAYVPTEPGDPCIPPDYRWKGSIWRFTTEGKALNPFPPDGAEDVSLYVILGWTPGTDANTHDVYFGTSFDGVNDANTSTPVIYRGPRDVNVYDPPEELLFGTTYFWRIDEVNDVNVKGNVWSFTTGRWDLIDDFESYDSTGKLNDVWKDWHTKYYGGGGPDNYNAAEVVLIEGVPPYRSPGNSMKYTYDWAAASEPSYCVVWRTYDSPENWAENGVVSLVLWFYGDANDGVVDPCYADGMSVTLIDWDDDAWTIEYDGDASDLIAKEWMMWGLSFKDFNDANNVNADKIKQIEIRIIGGSSGQIYFDDVQLYAPYCFDEYAYDLTGDCVTDEEDLDVMTEDWLDFDYTVMAEALSDANLLVHYVFDDVNGLNDVSGAPYYNGVAVNDVNVHDGILTLNNDGPNDINAVDIPFDGNNPFEGSVSFTIAMSVRMTTVNILFSNSEVSEPNAFSLYVTQSGGLGEGEPVNPVIEADLVADNVPSGWMGTGYVPIMDGQWHQVATTYDATTGYHKLYFDGRLSIDWTEYPATPEYPIWTWSTLNIADYTARIGGTFNDDALSMGAGSGYIGDIDNFRIYDRVLSHGEIVTLAGEASVYHPVDSEANLYDEEPIHFRKVNFKDFGVLANKWLVEELFGQ